MSSGVVATTEPGGPGGYDRGVSRFEAILDVDPERRAVALQGHWWYGGAHTTETSQTAAADLTAQVRDMSPPRCE